MLPKFNVVCMCVSSSIKRKTQLGRVFYFHDYRFFDSFCHKNILEKKLLYETRVKIGLPTKVLGLLFFLDGNTIPKKKTQISFVIK